MHSNQEGMGGESVEAEHASADRTVGDRTVQDRTARGQTAGAEGVGALTDEELLAGTRRLVCQANRVLAALLAHLAEVEPRGLHRSRACATLYTYQARLAGIQRYKVQFTASAEYVALVEEAKDLLAHSLPRADVAEIHLRALRTLVAALKRRKYASPAPRSKYEADMSSEPNSHESPASPLDDSHSVPPSDPALDTPPPSLASILRKPNAPLTEQPGPQPRAYVDEAPGHIPRSDPLPKSPRRRGRHVPAAVRRAVLERDGHRCAYVDARGLRCRETSRLELHHHEPFARGGPTTPENVSLYCAAHNALAAEQDFGRTSMIGKREHPHITQRALTHEPPHK